MPILQRYTRRDFEAFYSTGRWTSDHLLQIAGRHAELAPDRLAVLDGERRVGRAEVQTLSKYLAARFSIPRHAGRRHRRRPAAEQRARGLRPARADADRRRCEPS